MDEEFQRIVDRLMQENYQIMLALHKYDLKEPKEKVEAVNT